jgi:hypothetical protein
MPITFDGANKRIILDTTSVAAAEIWSRWVDWQKLADNSKWGLAFRQVGGDSLGSGLFIPPYFFLLNGWRIRPLEASHNLTITGNLFVDGGGVPVVSTLGVYQVNVNYTVPVQAQGIATGGGGGASASDIANAVLAILQPDFTAIKGTGYVADNHSLVKIKQQASLAAALSA